MNTLTTEQIREIFDGAPDGATHWDCGYIKMGGSMPFWWQEPENEWECMDNQCDDLAPNQLSDLRRILEQEEEILALRERVSELEDNIGMALSHNSMSYLLRKPQENTNERD